MTTTDNIAGRPTSLRPPTPEEKEAREKATEPGKIHQRMEKLRRVLDTDKLILGDKPNMNEELLIKAKAILNETKIISTLAAWMPEQAKIAAKNAAINKLKQDSSDKFFIHTSGKASPEGFTTGQGAMQRFKQLPTAERKRSRVETAEGRVIQKAEESVIDNYALYESIIDSFLPTIIYGQRDIIPIPINGPARSPNFKKNALMAAVTGIK